MDGVRRGRRSSCKKYINHGESVESPAIVGEYFSRKDRGEGSDTALQKSPTQRIHQRIPPRSRLQGGTYGQSTAVMRASAPDKSLFE